METLKNTIIVNKKELNLLIENSSIIGGDNFKIYYSKIDYTPKDKNDILNLIAKKDLKKEENFKVELDLGYTGWIQVGKAIEKAKK